MSVLFSSMYATMLVERLESIKSLSVSSSDSLSESSSSISSTSSSSSESFSTSSNASSASSESLSSSVSSASSTGEESVSSVVTSTSPEIVVSSSARSIVPFPSSSIASTNLSTWLGGKSAKLRPSKPSFNSELEISPSPLTSNLLNRVFTPIPVVATHFLRTSNTSSATKTTPQLGQERESTGTKEPHAPHSPSSWSDEPENFTPHSGHCVESAGITARHAPHSAIGTSVFSSSVIITPNMCKTSDDIIIHG